MLVRRAKSGEKINSESAESVPRDCHESLYYLGLDPGLWSMMTMDSADEPVRSAGVPDVTYLSREIIDRIAYQATAAVFVIGDPIGA